MKETGPPAPILAPTVGTKCLMTRCKAAANQSKLRQQLTGFEMQSRTLPCGAWQGADFLLALATSRVMTGQNKCFIWHQEILRLSC